MSPARYFMESEKNGVKFWLKARTIGLCAAFNRLLGYHPVRSTKPVVFLSSMFIKDNEHSNKRSDQHLAKCPDYPDPVFYLSHLGKYFFRNESLLHLRVEQFTRYLTISTRRTRTRPALVPRQMKITTRRTPMM